MSKINLEFQKTSFKRWTNHSPYEIVNGHFKKQPVKTAQWVQYLDVHKVSLWITPCLGGLWDSSQYRNQPLKLFFKDCP